MAKFIQSSRLNICYLQTFCPRSLQDGFILYTGHWLVNADEGSVEVMYAYSKGKQTKTRDVYQCLKLNKAAATSDEGKFNVKSNLGTED